MSNVLLRNRSVSELEFWKNGSDIRATVTQFLMRETNVPKRWRPVFTFPGVDLASLFIGAFGELGLGLGSETSQINAIAYPNSIDHYIKEVLRCKYYGRYMDDSYIICETKQQAAAILDALLIKYAEKGITVNRKKTAIVKLSRGFSFLKTHISLTDTGRVVCRPCRQSAVRQRRKLKKFKRFLDAGQMNMANIRTSYMSWRGFIAHKNARRTIRTMDALYQQLFGVWPINKEKQGGLYHDLQ